MHCDYAYIVSCFAGISPHNGLPMADRVLESIQWHLDFLTQYHYLRENHKTVQVIFRIADGAAIYPSALKQIQTTNIPDYIQVALLAVDNWGMMPGALWDGVQFLKENNIIPDYILSVEDDWLFNSWPERRAWIEAGRADVMGHFSSMGDVKDPMSLYYPWWQQGYKETTEETDRRIMSFLSITGQIPGAPAGTRRWCDGGFYMSSFDTLLRFEEKIKPLRFTLAPYCSDIQKCPSLKVPYTVWKADQKYDDPRYIYSEHGIFYGEIGFSTFLWAQGYTIKAFQEKSYIWGHGRVRDASQLTRGGSYQIAAFLHDEPDVHNE